MANDLHPLPLVGMQYFAEVQRTVCDDSSEHRPAACARCCSPSRGAWDSATWSTLTETLVVEALLALDSPVTTPAASAGLTQQRELIRSVHEYGDLFAHAAGVQP